MRNTEIHFTNGEVLGLTAYEKVNSSKEDVILFRWGNFMPITSDNPEYVAVFKNNINYITFDTDKKGE